MSEAGLEPRTERYIEWRRSNDSIMMREADGRLGGYGEGAPVLEFRAPLIGREAELSSLLENLERARSGHGSTVLISGEAGIGKTRLLDELKAIARSMGVHVLAASSLYESLTPYMPFVEALRSGGLENLFVQQAPRIEGMYLVTDTGLLIRSLVREERPSLDSDIFAGMLTTVNNFVQDSLGKLRFDESGDSMRRLDYGDYSVLLERLEHIVLATVVTGHETEFLLDDVRDSLVALNRKYGAKLKQWDGDADETKAVDDLLSPLLDKYDGIALRDDHPRAKRDLLFDSVALGLIRRARSTPILICLEDLQWADPSTLALVHYVTRSAANSGLLIVGTFRPEDLLAADGDHSSLPDTIVRLNSENLLQRINLTRMPETATRKVVMSLLGPGDFVSEIARIIHHEGEGNPLFSIELMKLMIEDGVIVEKNGSWKPVRPLNEWEIPTRIRDTILRRLDRVPDEYREVLDCASVMGEEFSSDILASALGAEKQWVLRALRSLDARHAMIHPRDGRYRFHHVKIKDVLYDEQPPELRGEYHETVARTTEKLNEADLDAVAGDLAFHYSRSKNRAKALVYLLKAADQAKRRYSNEEAIRLYREALEFAPNREERLEILEFLGSVQSWIGYFRECITSYKTALELASAKKARGRILTKLGAALASSGDLVESDRICKEAVECLQGEGSADEALALHNLGFSYRSRGEFGSALESFERSLAIRERLGDIAGMAGSFGHIGGLYENRGEFDRAAEFYHRSLEFAEMAGSESRLMMALASVGTVHSQRGEFDDALRYLGRSLALAEKLGDLEWIDECLGNIGNVHLLRGEYDKALERLSKCVSIGEKTDNDAILSCILPFRGLVRAERGDVLGGITDCEKSLQLLEGTASPFETAVCQLVFGYIHLIRGDLDQALARLRTSEELSLTMGAGQIIVEASSLIAEIYLRKGDLDTAVGYAARCSSQAEKAASQNLTAEAECVLGMIHRERGNFEESVRNFETSIEIRKTIGFLPKLRKSHYEFGLMWKKRGDVEKARMQLEIALSISEALGTPWASDQARKALMYLPT